MHTIHIQLLGDFRLLYNDEPVNMAHLARQQSLLAYLLFHRHAPQSRQQLAFLFWPDASEAQARANLRKALFELRRVLPTLDHFVQIEDKFLQWRSSTATTLDVERFTTSLARAAQAKQPEVAQTALEQAVALYGGDLLPACYDDWLLLERERLRQGYVKALEQLISLLEQRRELAAALAYAQRLLLHDSLHESTYRLLVRLHMLNGDHATALRTYHSCVTLLQQELGVDPSPETQQLYQRLLHLPTEPAAQAKPTSRAPKGMLSLVGRQSEWQTLHAAWHAAATGAAHCVLIAGEAGIGKTRLAEEMVQWAERQGYATARTRSYAAEGRLAYAPITDWLHAEPLRSQLPELEPVWLVEVARLLPELLVARPELSPPAPLADSWQRQRFREALARAITLAHQPLLLVFDDLQWCDNETLEWLHYLLRFAAQEPLLVVGTLRSEEAEGNPILTTLLANLRHADQLTDIELGYLNSAETATLAGQIAGDTFSHDQSVALYAQTEGHPLFIVEMVRASAKTGPLSEQATLPDSMALPPKVQAVIRSRLAQLSPSAQELVALAATIGRAFTLDVLAQASDSDEETLVRALDELWQRRLIREQGEAGYDFSHDRIREVAYTSVSSARRRLLHCRVAQALEQVYATGSDAISGEIADHYERADLPEQALLFYQKAAAVALHIYAHDEASSHLFKALELLKNLPVTPERQQQELTIYMSLTTSLTAVKGFSDSEVILVSVRAHELAVQAGDNSQRLTTFPSLFVNFLVRGELEKAYGIAKERLALAEEVGDPTRLATARGAMGVVLLHFGHWSTARTFLEQALDRQNDHPFYGATVLPVQHPGISFHRHLPIVLWHLGYPDQALEQMEEALMRSERLKHPYTIAGTHSAAAWLHQCRREFPLVQAQAERVIALSLEHSFTAALEGALFSQGWALAQQGQVEVGMAQMHQSVARLEATHEYLQWPGLLASLAELYGKVGQPEEGLRLLDKALDQVEARGERWSEAEIYRLRGELLRIQGADTSEVESHFLQALAIAQQQEAKSLELRAAMSLSRLWQAQGRSQEAHALLVGIYRWFTEGFSTPDLLEAKSLLKELS